MIIKGPSSNFSDVARLTAPFYLTLKFMEQNIELDRLARSLPQRLIVVGASTGGLTALSSFVSGLPSDLQAAVLIVQHIGNRESRLPELLQRHTALPVRFAADKDILQAGHILVAPPDLHLLVYQAHVRTVRSARENHARPAVDPLFRTAAAAHRHNVIGIVLSGDLDDGTVGLQAVKAYGGIVMVQDSSEAAAPSMPESAKRFTEVDYCSTAAALGSTAGKLATLSVAAPLVGPIETYEVDNRFAEMEGTIEDLNRIGEASNFTCPECHGALWQINGSMPVRFRCHTGHSYTARHLAESQDVAIEEALWGAIRALQEKQKLFEKFEAGAIENRQQDAAEEYAAQASAAGQQAVELRELVISDHSKYSDGEFGVSGPNESSNAGASIPFNQSTTGDQNAKY